MQPTRFTLDVSDQTVFLEYLAFYVAHLPEIDDMGSDLRKATSIAGNYYESHHGRTTSEDKLVDLVISLEALFSPAARASSDFASRSAEHFYWASTRRSGVESSDCFGVRMTHEVLWSMVETARFRPPSSP